MKYIPIAILWLWGMTAAYGEVETQGHISVGIIDTATITQSDDGAVTVSATIPPLYCTTDSTGTMCFY